MSLLDASKIFGTGTTRYLRLTGILLALFMCAGIGLYAATHGMRVVVWVCSGVLVFGFCFLTWAAITDPVSPAVRDPYSQLMVHTGEYDRLDKTFAEMNAVAQTAKLMERVSRNGASSHTKSGTV